MNVTKYTDLRRRAVFCLNLEGLVCFGRYLQWGTFSVVTKVKESSLFSFTHLEGLEGGFTLKPADSGAQQKNITLRITICFDSFIFRT